MYSSPDTHTGVLFRREVTDIVNDNPWRVTTLSNDVQAGSTNVNVDDVSLDYSNSVVKLIDGDSGNYCVTSTTFNGSIQTLHLKTPLLKNYSMVNTSVNAYNNTNASLIYTKDTDEYHFVHILSHDTPDESMATIGLHAKNILLEDGTHSSYADKQVSLGVTSTTPVDIPTTRTRGCYSVMIAGTPEDTAAATFVISKSDSSSTDFSVFRMTSSPSSRGEEIGLEWGSGKPLQLKHSEVRTSGNLGEVVTYNIKFLTNV
jgi:hypothetical protein